MTRPFEQADFQDLIDGRLQALCVRGGRVLAQMDLPAAVFPGAFNPLHEVVRYFREKMPGFSEKPGIWNFKLAHYFARGALEDSGRRARDSGR